MKISDQTSIAMPMRNLISIVVAVGFGVWAYFGVVSRLVTLETANTIINKDLESEITSLEEVVAGLVDGDIAQNTEFRIKWPRGDLGSPPADSEQFMLLEFLSGQVEAIQEQLESMMNNKVNIKRLQADMEKVLEDIKYEYEERTEDHGIDKTGKSKTYTNYFYLGIKEKNKSRDLVAVQCLDFSNELPYQDSLKLYVVKGEYVDWLTNEAYK